MGLVLGAGSIKMEFVLPELYKQPVALLIAGDATVGIPPRKKHFISVI